MLDHIARLRALIQAASGRTVEIEIGRRGDTSTVRVIGGAQPSEQAVIDAYDWSDAAYAAWLEDQQPERKNIRQAAANAIAANDTYIALANPTAAQNAAQIERLSQQMNAVIRRLIQLD